MSPPDARQEALDHRGGLIGAYRLHANGQGTAVAWETIESDPLGSREHGDLWLHFERTAPRVRAWIENHSRIPRPAWPALFSDDPRPRIAHFEGIDGEAPGMVVILRGLNLNRGAAIEDMVSVRIWIDEHRIITLRRRKIATIRSLRERLLKGTGPRDSADFISQLAAGLNDQMLPALDEMDASMDEAEDALTAGDCSAATRSRIASVRRRAIQIRRYIQPQKEVLHEFARTTPPWFTRADRMLAHDAADGTARVVDGLDEIRDRASAAYEEITVLGGERATRQNARLTAVATVFLPLGLIAGIWGMNFDNLPFADQEAGVWVVLGMMVVTSVFAGCIAVVLSRRV